jgi:hypothetical protein
VIRVAAGVLLALVIGFFGLSLVFSDLGPGETEIIRTAVSVSTFLVGGFVIGLIVGRRAWLLSALVSWGAVLLGLFSFRVGVVNGLTLTLPPLLLALSGGFLSVLAYRALAAQRRDPA